MFDSFWYDHAADIYEAWFLQVCQRGDEKL